jgi:hypothetical protein
VIILKATSFLERHKVTQEELQELLLKHSQWMHDFLSTPFVPKCRLGAVEQVHLSGD